MKKNILISFSVFLICILEVSNVISYTNGAPDGFTGSPFDDQTCATYCHHGAPETPFPGIITSNIPSSGYIPGTTYTISANLVKPGHSKFGFQISPMDDHGNVLGSMIELTSETQITGMGTYITHSQSGTTGLGSKSWSFDWVAPEGGTGDITFYGAFNVTNNNGSNNGDSIFTSTYTISEDITVGIELVNSENEINIYPNPANNFIYVSIPEAADEINVNIYSISGNISFCLKGSNSGIFQLPETIVSGVYYIYVDAAEKKYSRKLIVL